MVILDTNTLIGHDLADAAIAATCLVNDCQLATLNEKDFAGIAGLEMVEI